MNLHFSDIIQAKGDLLGFCFHEHLSKIAQMYAVIFKISAVLSLFPSYNTSYKLYNEAMANMKKEGRRLRRSPFYEIIPYIMVERADAQNHIEISFETANAEAMIKELRQEGYDSIGMLHIILAAYVRAVSQRPSVNRFIRGQRIWARNGIVVNLVAKTRMRLDAEDTTIKMVFTPRDTIIDVYNKFNEAYGRVAEGSEGSGDKAARIVCYIPGLLKKMAIGTLRFLDYFGMLPRAVVDASPFHGSLFITNMASLNIPPIVHHLYNFGNVPVFIAFGAKRYEIVLDEEGNASKKRVIDFVANLDERICDGYYYASAMKLFLRYFKDPEELLNPPENVICDIP